MLTALVALLFTPTDPPQLTLPSSIQTHKGQTLALTGHPATVVVFITTTCPVARSMQPALTRLHTRFTPQKVQFLAVQVDPTLTPQELDTFIADYKTPLPQAVDKNHRLVKALKATITPQAFVLDRQGHVVYQGRIDDTYPQVGVKKDPTQHDLQNAIEAVLAGKTPPVPQTTPVGCLIPALSDF